MNTQQLIKHKTRLLYLPNWKSKGNIGNSGGKIVFQQNILFCRLPVIVFQILATNYNNIFEIENFDGD